MASFKLDQDGDLDVTNNEITLTEGLEEKQQHLQSRFSLFRGEWFLDTNLGVPWFQDVLVKNPSFAVVQEILKDTVLDTPGVLELMKFNFSFDSSQREATLEFQALCEDGPINFEQLVGV